MHIKMLSNGKYSLDAEFGYSELKSLLPVEMAAASVDIDRGDLENCRFRIHDQDLYGRVYDPDTDQISKWFFFDVSVRRWQLCDDPTKS